MKKLMNSISWSATVLILSIFITAFQAGSRRPRLNMELLYSFSKNDPDYEIYKTLSFNGPLTTYSMNQVSSNFAMGNQLYRIQDLRDIKKFGDQYIGSPNNTFSTFQNNALQRLQLYIDHTTLNGYNVTTGTQEFAIDISTTGVRIKQILYADKEIVYIQSDSLSAIVSGSLRQQKWYIIDCYSPSTQKITRCYKSIPVPFFGGYDRQVQFFIDKISDREILFGASIPYKLPNGNFTHQSLIGLSNLGKNPFEFNTYFLNEPGISIYELPGSFTGAVFEFSNSIELHPDFTFERKPIAISYLIFSIDKLKLTQLSAHSYIANTNRINSNCGDYLVLSDFGSILFTKDLINFDVLERPQKAGLGNVIYISHQKKYYYIEFLDETVKVYQINNL